MKFKYFKIKDIYDDLFDVVNSMPDIEYMKVLEYVRMQRGQSSIFTLSDGSTENDLKLEAVMNFISFLQSSGTVIIPMIRMYDEELEGILKLDKITEGDSTINKEGTNNQEAFSDHSLTKENDTPDGVNVDLTSDNFLTSSSRSEIEGGARASATTEDSSVISEVREIDNVARLNAIKDLNFLKKSVYQDWLELIDTELLVFHLHN